MVMDAPHNLRISRHSDIMGRHDPTEGWAERVLEDGRNRGVWISGPPGTPPDPHIHPDFNEWWIALDGNTQWQIGQYEPVLSEWGDIIMAPAGYAHDIRPKADVQSVRFAVTHPNSNHDIKGIVPCRFIKPDVGESTPNLIHTKFRELIERNGTTANWQEVVVSDQRNVGTYVHELPGTSSDAVSHPDENRWWVVLQGEIECTAGGEEVVTAGPGDVTFIEQGKSYSTRTVGDEPSIRITIAAPAS